MSDFNLRQAANDEIRLHHSVVQTDPYKLTYHLSPPVGLLNDPNGLIQLDGTYHIFFQWMPFDTGHGAKFWGHYTTKDFVSWELQRPALTPSDWFDRNGCYSGSAIYHNNELYVFYTGNVKNAANQRESYQCMATSSDTRHFQKHGVVLHVPDGYTAHFRDPKVWQHDGTWYMIIGAQTEELVGKAVLFSSENLTDWTWQGNIAGGYEQGLQAFGYMWECPDLFRLADVDILIVSPQGLEPEGMNYHNTYQSGYFAGSMNDRTGKLEHGAFHELDHGFEFYAPQTMLDEHGRRILIAWMGVPDQYEQAHPTVKHKWVHALTLPRELSWDGECVLQQPLHELQKLRSDHIQKGNIQLNRDARSIEGVTGTTLELLIHLHEIEHDFTIRMGDYAAFHYDAYEQVATLSRPHLIEQEVEVRQCKISSGLHTIHAFLDTSSLELFINQGAHVFTSRLFPEPENETIIFQSRGTSTFSLDKWTLNGRL
ncbi:sucrose-6-phosphate hydrolase [Thalassobacillus sp. CUG 92003]|uniref:glycoside hydrolase family 32 protein n=1 Tax=Thalassobacillus sp. CUG 92003 TaxID=2736641 RepID=UPI0015E7922E|nr:sucrose-6-phosphate hydrolase [Thalassobacillus sp. CUG 92003]